MKRPAVILLALWAWASAFAAGPAAPLPALSKEAILREALRDNPSLKAARARWEMMKQRVPQARAWEDPMAGVSLERMGTLRPGQISDAEWMISQAIPISGKNRSKGRAAEAEALAARQEWRRARLEVVLRVNAAYDRLAGAYGQLEINTRTRELLEQLARVSRTKYETGSASQSDVLMAETELARLDETRASLERDLSDQQTQLNLLANRPPGRPLGPPAPLAFAPPRPGNARAAALAARQRPEILMARRKIETGRARLQLARRQWIPDPQLTVAARQFSGGAGIREYDTGIAFSLPWSNPQKYRAGVAEAEAGLESARREYESAQAETAGMVRDQLKKIETLAANVRLYREKVTPMARSAVESARAGYETGKSGFLDVITASRALQEIESAALAWLVEYAIAAAELDAMAGIGSTLFPDSP